LTARSTGGILALVHLRRKLGRFVIDPKPAQLASGADWLPEFSLEEHLGSHVEGTVFFSQQVLGSCEEAIQACYQLGRREIARRLEQKE